MYFMTGALENENTYPCSDTPRIVSIDSQMPMTITNSPRNSTAPAAITVFAPSSSLSLLICGKRCKGKLNTIKVDHGRRMLLHTAGMGNGMGSTVASERYTRRSASP